MSRRRRWRILINAAVVAAVVVVAAIPEIGVLYQAVRFQGGPHWIRPLSATEPVSVDDAVSAAWDVMAPASPQRIVVTLVELNGHPEWIVSFVGGDTCPPVHAPSLDDVQSCVGNVWNVRIDAENGSFLSRFADGRPIPNDLVASLPVAKSVEELLAGPPTNDTVGIG